MNAPTNAPGGPTAPANDPAGTTPAKRWASACARAALLGRALHRTDPADGPVRLFAEVDGQVVVLRDLDQLEALLLGPAA